MYIECARGGPSLSSSFIPATPSFSYSYFMHRNMDELRNGSLAVSCREMAARAEVLSQGTRAPADPQAVPSGRREDTQVPGTVAQSPSAHHQVIYHLHSIPALVLGAASTFCIRVTPSFR